MFDGIGESTSSLNIGLLREQRQLLRDARIEAATELLGHMQWAPEQVIAHQRLYNQALMDGMILRGGEIACPWTPLRSLRAYFKTLIDDHNVRRATRPNPNDNDDARGIKQEYRDSYNEAKKERARAARIAAKLGPGVHHLSNGDTVTVSKNPKTGDTTVTTQKTDGSTKAVTLNEKDPTRVDVKKISPDGTEDDLSMDGTTVTRAHVDEQGETSTQYSLDEYGRPVRERRGPQDDDDERTVVNPDGSTDTRDQIYTDDEGQPVYEDHHRNACGCGA